MAKSSKHSRRENLETFTLIWLDSDIHTTQDNIETKTLLRKAINRLKTCQDPDNFIEYIQTIPKERVVLIVSGRLGQEVVPIVHKLPQLIAIYVYCTDKKRHEKWAKKYSKIKGVIIDLKELIAQIQTDQTQRNKYKLDEPLPIGICHIHLINKSSIIYNDNFIFFQLLINCLVQMKCDLHDKKHFISLCKEEYNENETELNLVQEFETSYTAKKAIWWLTRDSFLFRMLNKAFQVIDIDLLYNIHFLIHDIHQEIKAHKVSSAIRTYKPYLLSNEELQVLRHSIGEFISINTFLLTIPSHDRALKVLKEADVSEGLNQVLFEIDADPNIPDIKPFSDITLLNYYNGHENILFMAGTIFYFINMQKENNVFVIKLEACADTDKRLKPMFDEIKTESNNNKPTNLFSLASILLKMKKIDEAENCYYRTIELMPNDYQTLVQCYQGLAKIAEEKEDYDLSVKFHQKAIEINQVKLKAADSVIAENYCDISDVYIKKEDYFQAREAVKQALDICVRSLGKDNPKIATYYVNIGDIYEMEKKHTDAVEYFQKALELRQKTQSSPADRLEVAKLYNSIGSAYKSLGDHKQALKNLDAALKIMKKSPSTQSIDLMVVLKNTAQSYEASGHLEEALQYFEEASALECKLLKPDDPEVLDTKEAIKRLRTQLKLK